MSSPTCPYCGDLAVRVDSVEIYGPGTSYGYFWLCRACWAYCGAHRTGPHRGEPLGTLADRELRELRRKAHGLFDPIWKTGTMTRSQAYRHLQDIMGVPSDRAHIAMFSPEQCRFLIACLQE